jgi:protein-tyrosine phosphatase
MNKPFHFEASACSVERLGDQNYRLRWHGSLAGETIAIYMFDNPAHLYDGSAQARSNLSAPIVSTTNHEVIIPNPDAGVRHYFCLQPLRGKAMITLAERKLNLQGTPNFRDLGGYVTIDGRHIKWGKLYRSGKLSTLTPEDIRYFNRLGVALVCDFRQDLERELEPTQLGDQSTPLFTGAPVALGSSGNFMENLYNGIIEVYDSADFMKDINRDFVINQIPQYAQMFRFLLTGDHPILIHCASGKDRTGFGAALILDVLGVGEETIIHDYLLTNDYLSVEEEVKRLSGTFTDNSGSVVPESVLRPLIEVRPEYLHACFEEIEKIYQSRENFYASALGLDHDKLELLRDHYVE